MAHKWKGIALTVLAACSVLAASATPAGGAPAASGAAPCSFSLRIGDVLPFTGDLAAYGANLDRAVKLGVNLQKAALRAAKLNAGVTLVASEDGQTQASASVEAATKLVKSGKVNVIIGEMASGATIPMAQSVTIPNKIVQISPTSSAPQLTTIKAGTTASSRSPIPPLRSTCSEAEPGHTARKTVRSPRNENRSGVRR